MFSFLAVHAGKPGSASAQDERVSGIAARVFSWTKHLKSTKWASPSGDANLWTWSDEGANASGSVVFRDGAAQVALGSGRFGPSCTIDTSGVKLTRPLGTIEPVFYAERPGAFVVSNKAILVALFIAEGSRPALDLSALSGGAVNGYTNGCFMAEGTPFAGVSLAKPNADATWKGGSLRISDPDDDFANYGFGDEELGSAQYDELCALFLEGLAPVAPSLRGSAVGLTGGQDSRLLCAALKALNADFTTKTLGFETNPDVVMGERVAQFLGVPHVKLPPPAGLRRTDPVFRISPRREIAESLLVSGGMYLPKPTATYLDRMASAGSSEVSLVVGTDGSELWRGGYSNRRFSWFDPEVAPTDITAAQVTDVIKDIFGRYAHLLRPEYRVPHEEYCARWLQPCLDRGRPIAAAERFYLEFEYGRYASAVASSAPGKVYFSPFSNPAVIRRIGRAKTRYRRDDLIHYNLTKRLAPGLENLPFDAKRWGFEWHGPADEADRAGWQARQPIFERSSVTAATWGEVYAEWPIYGMVGSDCWHFMRDELFGYADGENVWTFLDRNALLRAFSSDEIFTPNVSALFWVIYGLSILMAGDWLQLDRIADAPIEVRYSKPWALIYKDLYDQGGEIERRAHDRLTAGVAAALGRTDAAVSSGQAQPRTLFVLEDSPAGTKWVGYAPGAGRTVRLNDVSDRMGRSWRVDVEASSSSAPASSYLVLPLGRFDAAGEVALTMTFRARSPATARSHLNRYAGKTRYELAGSVIRYDADWQTMEHRFNLRQDIDRRGSLEVNLLLGLPDDTNQAEFRKIEIAFFPITPPRSLGDFLAKLEQDTLADLRAAAEVIRNRYQLSDIEAQDLLKRANLQPLLDETGRDGELLHFEKWLRTEAGRASAARKFGGFLSRSWRALTKSASSRAKVADPLAARIRTADPRWRLPNLCYGLAEGILARLLENGAPLLSAKASR